MNTAQDYWTTRALLEWQVEMGVDEAMLDAAIDRYALADEAPKPVVQTDARPTQPSALPDRIPRPDPPPAPPTAAERLASAVAASETAAARAGSLEQLTAALAAYDHCDLRKGARGLVFSDGNPAARVMILGEAPGREEDQAGRPFVGPAGKLLDKMLASIGLGRAAQDPAQSVYLTTLLPWRPPADRAPDASEIAMLLPFVRRHIDLAAPDILVLLGNTPCQALLGQQGVARLRGQWTMALGRPCLPMVHPADLMRRPEGKRDAWADLLSLKARLKSLP